MCDSVSFTEALSYQFTNQIILCKCGNKLNLIISAKCRRCIVDYNLQVRLRFPNFLLTLNILHQLKTTIGLSTSIVIPDYTLIITIWHLISHTFNQSSNKYDLEYMYVLQIELITIEVKELIPLCHYSE